MRLAMLALHDHVVVALKLHTVVAMETQAEAERGHRDASNLGILIQRMGRFESDEAFLTAVTTAMADYDPATTEISPDAALFGAIQTQLDRQLGPLLREIKAGAPQPLRLTRRSLGDEIRRRLALPSSSRARIVLEEAMKTLTDEERVFLATLYGDGGYKGAQRRWSGRKIDELRNVSIPKLVEALPELRRFVV